MGCEKWSALSAIHDLKDGGCRLFGVNGHVKKPQIVELAVGVTLRELIYDIGGGILGTFTETATGTATTECGNAVQQGGC